MDALDIDKWRSVSDTPGTSIAVSSILMGLVMVGRAAFVFPLSFLSNLAKKNQSEKINFNMQVCIILLGTNRFNNSSGFQLFISIIFSHSLGCDLVVWSHERCCIYGSCIQQGIKRMSLNTLYEASNDTNHHLTLVSIVVYKGRAHRCTRECNHDHEYDNCLSF